ncbi:MAG: M20/M25/M40 family metallo-hydrolase [Candidatus Latescibacterota bacterium]|jgi:acetylornithine deacetylase
MDAEERDLLKRVESLQDRLVAWTRELVAIPTVNPYSGDDSAGTERPGQDWIEARLRAMGAQVRRLPVPPDVYARGGIIGPANRRWEGRENVVGEWVLGSGDGPCLLLNDHMDTVGTAGMRFDPFDPVIEDGCLFGRGSSDSKGNLAMGLTALQALLAEPRGLHGRVIFESVVDEECNGAGAGTLACCLAGITGDFALCLDGTHGQVDIGCNGVVTARVLVEGRAAHGSGQGAVSALDKGIVVKAAVDAFAREHAEIFPDCRVNIGVFRAGTLPAIVPGQAELQINLNYDIQDADQAEQQEGVWDGRFFRARFERAMAELEARDEWFARHPVAVSWIKDIYPFWCDPTEPRIEVVLQAAAEVHGGPVEAKLMPAWIDAAHLARQLRVPAVALGAGTAGTAHGAGEYVVLADLYSGARTLALALHRLLRA